MTCRTFGHASCASMIAMAKDWLYGLTSEQEAVLIAAAMLLDSGERLFSAADVTATVDLPLEVIRQALIALGRTHLEVKRYSEDGPVYGVGLARKR